MTMNQISTQKTTRPYHKKKYVKPTHRFVEQMKLHPKQQRVWDAYFSGKYRNLVINAGRRFGKSTVCMAIAIEVAVNYGKKVWWVGKTYRDASKQWRDAKQLLNGVYTAKSETDHRMEFHFTFPDGTIQHGEIAFRSADTPDNLRGDGLDLLILDEAAFQSPDVYKVLRPSLADHKGDIIFISTPNGYNWFYEFWVRGQKENRENYPRWWSAHFTSYDNSLIDPAEIDAAKADMTETEFKIEHMAEFIDDVGKVFTNVRACAKSPMQDTPKVYGQYCMGIDLGRKHDATVISVFDTQNLKQIYGIRYVGQDWDLQKLEIANHIKGWRPEVVFVDSTGVGQSVVEDLQNLVPTANISPFVLTHASKPPLIQKLAILLQNKQIEILASGSDERDFARIQTEELLAYEVQKSKDGMRSIYSAPRGGKDDTVIALALSVMGMHEKERRVSVAPNPFYPQAVRQDIPQSIRLNEYAKKARAIQIEVLKEMELFNE